MFSRRLPSNAKYCLCDTCKYGWDSIGRVGLVPAPLHHLIPIILLPKRINAIILNGSSLVVSISQLIFNCYGV